MIVVAETLSYNALYKKKKIIPHDLLRDWYKTRANRRTVQCRATNFSLLAALFRLLLLLRAKCKPEKPEP